MTVAAQKFNKKYNLNISPSSFKKTINKNPQNELVGKPTKNITQVFKRFFKTPWAVISLLFFLLIVVTSIIAPIFSQYSAESSISQGGSTLADIKNLETTGITTQWVSPTDITKINNYQVHYDVLRTFNGKTLIRWNPYDLISKMDNGFKHFSIIGTDDVGRDIWTRTWSGTWRSIQLAFIVVIITTIVGTLLGSWIGLYVGTIIDIIVIKIIAVYNSIPTIIWYALIMFLLPKGWTSLVTIFVVTGWTRGMGLSRMYMWKYVNSDFMKAAKISGVSKFGRIIKHALPNYIGIIAITFVSSIPAIIEGEAALAFLGFSPNPNNASLGNVINEAQKIVRGSDHLWYLMFPVILIFTITISLKYVAIGINDAFDPKTSSRR